MLLPNHLLALLSFQALHRLRDLVPWREDWGALRCFMVDMYECSSSRPVLSQKRLDGCARGCGVGNLEQTGSVFLLSVNDDEGGVGSGGGGRRNAQDFTERFGHD